MDNKQYMREYYEKNKEKLRLYAREYYNENKEMVKRKSKIYSKEYRSKNQDIIRIRKREYYLNNKEKEDKRIAEWRARNLERVKEYTRNWKERNPENVFNDRLLVHYRRGCPKTVNDITYIEWLKLLEVSGKKCLRCGSTEKLTIDMIVPHSKGGFLVLDNIQVLCNRCNAGKRNRIVDYRSLGHGNI